MRTANAAADDTIAPSENACVRAITTQQPNEYRPGPASSPIPSLDTLPSQRTLFLMRHGHWGCQDDP